MRLRDLAAVVVTSLFMGLSCAAEARTFKFAFQGDLNALDPYTINESFTIGVMSNVLEGLTKRDKDLKIVPGLAERWEVIDPLKWRFYLRKGVKFHEGQDFTADDVLFSLDRLRTPGSQLKNLAPADMTAVKVDAFTVDFILKSPNPILNYEWHNWYMISKSWAEANGATQVQAVQATALSPGALKANGTGPFIIVSHEPGIKTVFKPNPNWWDKPEHNLDEVIFQTIKSEATRVAALLSGEIDMMEPVPVQDIERVKANATTDVLVGPELRTIFLNMDQMRPELLYSSVKGKNPFKVPLVRKAIYQAIDIEAIKSRIMRNLSVPSSVLMTPVVFPQSAEIKRHPYDVAAAKKLMADAGYGQGFEVEMDCPNDRYVNDEAICQAVTQMLARIDIKVKLNAMPKAKYFEKAGPAKYDSSFNLLGWTAATLDSLNVLVNVLGCRDEKGKGAAFNYGGYCNPKIDEIAKQVTVETDKAKRDQLIVEAFKINHEEVGIIPLHQQSLAWGISRKIKIAQRADDYIQFFRVQKQD